MAKAFIRSAVNEEGEEVLNVSPGDAVLFLLWGTGVSRERFVEFAMMTGMSRMRARERWSSFLTLPRDGLRVVAVLVVMEIEQQLRSKADVLVGFQGLGGVVDRLTILKKRFGVDSKESMQ